MPSFGTQSRTYSWPPSLHHVSHLPHVKNNYNHTLTHEPQPKAEHCNPPSFGAERGDSIDADPFSHFLSPVVDEDVDTVSSAAHTLSTESFGNKRDRFIASVASRWARSIADRRPLLQPYSNHTRHHVLNTKYDIEIRAPQSLVTSGSDALLPERSTDSASLIPTIVVTEYIDSDASRQRVQQLLTLSQRLHGRQRTTRTLSGHRHSWQEPSMELYTVLEEGRIHEVAVVEESDSVGSEYGGGDAGEGSVTLYSSDEEGRVGGCEEELDSEDEALYDDDNAEVGYDEEEGGRQEYFTWRPVRFGGIQEQAML